ncbi:ABC transporter ATP-binding protein [Streptomyces kronopolitis]|uniref:ABC transporter ATP-binding protein n=1 Tax=Streptomyces kronopolitis TaxID=1612435 RepID=UPI003425B690
MTVHTAHETAHETAHIRDLRVEVGGRALVDGVSLRLAPGRITALIGASGSGKTTTGRALLHEYPPGATVTGEVSVPDTPVGYVPQHPATALNPARPVAALLQDLARAQVRHLPRRDRRPAARRRVLHALDRAQLPDGAALLRRYPHQLSGGQQQRVVLAQALLAGATTIVADEPTTGQDALTKREIAAQLAAVARQGIAVLLLSHDLDLVRALADEVHVLHAGRLVESGPPELLRHAPQHPRTRALCTPSAPTAAAAFPAFPAPDTVLHVSDLTARHGTTRVLHVPELRLTPGCLAVVGRSGSGKTTLGRCLAGLHRAHDGQLRLDGAALPRSLRDRSRTQLAAVQYVFQDAHASFDAHRAILDQVARSAVRLRRIPRAEATAEAVRTLRSLGLTDDLVCRTPDQLSGGELQRAALARALLARPRVLICDEITSGLDPVTRRGLLTLLEGLLRADPDLCLVLITHERDTAALATTLAVLDAGRLVEQGPAARLRTAPRHALTAGLLQVPGPAPQPPSDGPHPQR